MKKNALILVLAMLVSLLAACGGPGDADSGLTAPAGSTSELMDKLYENVTVELPLITTGVDFSDEYALSAYIGTTDASSLVEASVSESMIGAQAYSVVLVRVTDAAAAEEVARTMFDQIDTRKWICVEATEKQAAVCGDLVCFVMLSPDYGVTSDQIIDAFTAMCGGKIGTVIQ